MRNPFKPIKEIRSREGVLHFRRWQLLSIPFTTVRVYLHMITRADEDKFPHNHPWNLWTMILRGGYKEDKVTTGDDGTSRITVTTRRKFGSMGSITRDAYHRVTKLYGPQSWSLAVVWGERQDWGYLAPWGHMTEKEYRVFKHNLTDAPPSRSLPRVRSTPLEY